MISRHFSSAGLQRTVDLNYHLDRLLPRTLECESIKKDELLAGVLKD